MMGCYEKSPQYVSDLLMVRKYQRKMAGKKRKGLSKVILFRLVQNKRWVLVLPRYLNLV
jgi:hypothetical protein